MSNDQMKGLDGRGSNVKESNVKEMMSNTLNRVSRGFIKEHQKKLKTSSHIAILKKYIWKNVEVT